MSEDKKSQKKETEEIKKDNSKDKEPKFSSLSEAYGNKRISESIFYKHTFDIENKQSIPYCFVITDNSPMNNSSFQWNQIRSKRIYTNLGDRTIQQKAVEIINSTQDFVCISSFLFENDTQICKALYEVSKNGKQVYILIASQHLVDAIKEGDEDRESNKGHIAFLNEAGQGYMFIHSGDVHSKFILVDPNGPNPQGLLSTANLTERALTKNNELGIVLNPKQVKDLFSQFVYGFFSVNTTEYRFDPETKKARLEPISSIPRDLAISQEVIWTTANSNTIGINISKIIKDYSPDDEILISCWNFVLDNAVSQAILSKIGSNCKFLIHNSSKNWDGITKMLEKGVNVRCNALQHAKFILTKSIAVVFSANIEFQGLEKGFESGAILTDPSELEALRKIFMWWFDNAEEIGMYNQFIGQLQAKKVKILSDSILQQSKSAKGGRIDLSPIRIEPESKADEQKITWALDKYQLTVRDDDVQSLLLEEDRIPAKENVYITKYPIIIKPKAIPNEVTYLKSIDGYHIWQKFQGKKVIQNYLVFPKDPIKEQKAFNEASKIAKSENIELIIF
jgi:hypothetical protein